MGRARNLFFRSVRIPERRKLLADLAVLSDDYLTVSDDRILKIKSVFTLQGGRIVHASGEFAGLAGT
jgi:hypothetical protein